jgi:predicted nucleic acid-binding protein
MSKIVKIRSRFKVVKEGPSDDIVLKAAYNGNADYIVSADDHLLALKEFKGIKMVSISDTLELAELLTKCALIISLLILLLLFYLFPIPLFAHYPV